MSMIEMMLVGDDDEDNVDNDVLLMKVVAF